MANVELDPNRIVEGAQRILDTVVDHFVSNGVTIPEHRYLAVGELGSTAHDKEQITVGFSTLMAGLPNNNSPMNNNCSAPDNGVFYVELVRCTPQPIVVSGGLKSIAPAQATLNDYAISRMRDAWLLKRVAETIPSPIFNSKVVYGISVPPEMGGMQAIVLTLNMVV